MSKKTGVVLLLGWLVLLWIVFLIFQQRTFTATCPAGPYILALAEVLAILLVTTSIGLRLLLMLGYTDPTLVAAGATGLALAGIVTLGLAGLGILRPYVIWPVIAALAGLSFRQMISILGRLKALPVPRLKPAEALISGFVLVALAICLINCLAPLTANDALVYHLSLPKIYAAQGHLTELPYNAYANMPHYGEMLYTLFYSIAGELGAKLFYFFMLVAATAAVVRLARRFVETRLALAAAGIFLTQPLLLDHRIICNIDVMLAYFFLSAILLALDAFKQTSKWERVIPLSLVVGFMLGMKYTAIAPCVSLLVVLWAFPARRPPYRTVLLGIAVTALVVAPWAVKSELLVGNPFYPVLEKTFDGENWDAVQGSQLVAWQKSMGMGRSALDYLLLPVNLSTRAKPGMNYSRFDGTITPAILILLPLALLKRNRRLITLIVVAAIGFVFWALTSQQLRFLIPVIALLSVIGIAGLGNVSKHVSAGSIRIVLLLLILIQISGLIVPDQYGKPFMSSAFGDRLGVVAGTETREDYLARTLQPFSMFDHINRTLPVGEPIFMIWENRSYYLDRPHFADSFFEASTLMRIAARADGPAGLRREIEAMGYRYVLVNDLLGEVFARAYSRRDVSLLMAFISDHLEPVHTTNRMTLYRMKNL